MSLKDVIEETKKQLEQVTNVETENQEEIKQDDKETSGSDEAEETDKSESDQKVEEKTNKEEPKEEVEKKEEAAAKKEESAEFARLRREKNAAERENKALKEKLEGKVEKELEPEEAINQELVDVIQQNRIQKAEKEYAMLEAAVFQENPDAEATANAYKAAIYQSIKIQNPRKSHVELLDLTKNTLLSKAGEYVRKGLNPIQELLDEAVSLGIQPQSPQKEEEDEAEEVVERKKPDLDKLAKNKKRNAGTAAATGSAGGSGQLTPGKATTMSVAEWAKLPVAERQRLMRGG